MQSNIGKFGYDKSGREALIIDDLGGGIYLYIYMTHKLIFLQNWQRVYETERRYGFSLFLN